MSKRISVRLAFLSLGMAAGLGLLTLGACGGSSSSPSTPTPTPTPAPAPTPTPTPTPTPAPMSAQVVINSSGVVTPKTVTIAVGGTVTFVNQHSQNHEQSSDPHPFHTDCPQINNVGVLVPGQSRSTGPFPAARTCGYHDHGQETNTNLQGTIVIQ